MIKINKKDWFYLGQWLQPVLSSDFWLYWAETDSVKKISRQRCISNVIEVKGHYYFWKKTLNDVSKESYLAAKKNKGSYFRNFVDVTSSRIKKVLSVEKRLASKKRITDSELEYFYQELTELFGPWFIIFLISEGVEKLFYQELKRYKLNAIELTPLLQPSLKPWINMQHIEMQSFVGKLFKRKIQKILYMSPNKAKQMIIRKFPSLNKRIQSHLDRFEWVGTHHFWGEPLTWKKLLSEMKQEASNYPFHKAKMLRIKLPKRIKRIIRIINELAYWRLRCAEVSDHAIYYMLPHMKNAARKLGIPYDIFYWLTVDEIMLGLRGESRLDKNSIRQRRVSHGMVYYQGVKEIYTGVKLERFMRRLPKIDKDAKGIIKGTVACKGKAVGRVRIMIEPSVVKKFKKGEILVAPETTPDFVPAMKLAAAVVTNLGGLACHAAIVSREMNIPCIVGTSSATRVLNNGDLVEVDANKGIVKKLSITNSR